jgi:NAD(P)H dehydrogenase (quinone)
MDLIIFAHPANKLSHNAVVLEYVKQRISGMSREYAVIDLYAEKFDPLLRLIDERDAVAKNSQGVRGYQELISRSERLIFIYPVWWYNMPSILKGFIEKVFTSGFAFDFKREDSDWVRVKPLLTGKKAVVINTYGHGKELFEQYGRSAESVLDKSVLGFCGIKTTRVNWFDVRYPSDIPDDVKKKIDKALE